jgi:hypothetical protein
MGYREFVDEDGREWKVWDVKPAPRLAPAPISPRRAESRGGTATDEVTPTAHVSPGWENGWLAFQSEGIAKRLRPIPAGWETTDVAVLQLYLRRAVPAPQKNAP